MYGKSVHGTMQHQGTVQAINIVAGLVLYMYNLYALDAAKGQHVYNIGPVLPYDTNLQVFAQVLRNVPSARVIGDTKMGM
jgi:hypothetical protein